MIRVSLFSPCIKFGSHIGSSLSFVATCNISFLSTSELRVRLAQRETGLSPPVTHFYCAVKGGASFADHLCYFCLLFVMLSCASVC